MNRKSHTDEIEDSKVYHVKFKRMGINLEMEIFELDMYLDIEAIPDEEFNDD